MYTKPTLKDYNQWKFLLPSLAIVTNMDSFCMSVDLIIKYQFTFESKALCELNTIYQCIFIPKTRYTIP